MKIKKCVSSAIAVVAVIAVIFITYGITRGIVHDNLEKACVEAGWYETQNYRLVCQDINE